MLKRRYVLALILALVGSLTLTQRASNNAAAEQSNIKGSVGKLPQASSHTITVTPWGPSQESIDNVKANLPQHPAVQAYLRGTRFRLVSFELVDKGKINGNIEPPDSYNAVFFDYTNNRAYSAGGRFDGSDVKVEAVTVQPDPSEEEFNVAAEIIMKDPKLGPSITDKTLDLYPPMPPLVNDVAPVGKTNRTIAVGIKSGGGNAPEIVGVDMITETVVRFATGAPASAIAAVTACGPNSAGQSTTPRGTAGSFNVVISRNGVEIWNMIVIRPSVSSGTRASGIEIQNVNYRGQRVLTRGHAPILNVQYDRNLCGPFRDWSYQEDMFSATGTDAAPGIRLCTSPPATILESGVDSGNFRGVAVFDNREEVTMETEMQAGWYRYLMEWTFTDAGVIRPRYGFGATNNGCVCNIHTHHVYWRFDFDIGSMGNNATEFSPAGSAKIEFESMRPRLFGQDQTWTIKNALGVHSATIIPGPHDQNYDKYGKGDVWILLNKPSELDDGINCTTCTTSFIQIDPFMNAESVFNADLVMWYGAHFNHHDASNGPAKLIGEHVVGPDIVLKGY